MYSSNFTSSSTDYVYFENPFTIIPFVAIGSISELSAAYWNYNVDYISLDKFRATIIGDQPSSGRNFVYIAIGK